MVKNIQQITKSKMGYPYIASSNRKKFERIVEQYLADNYKKIISPMLQRRDLGKGSKVHTPESAVKEQKKRIMDYYLD